MAAYVDGKVDRVDIFYNGYVSPLVQEVRRETLLPLQEATILEARRRRATTRTRAPGTTRSSSTSPAPRRSSSASIPDYVEISLYRALLESTASELRRAHDRDAQRLRRTPPRSSTTSRSR